MRSKRNSALFLALVLFFTCRALPQQYKAAPLPVQKSTFISQLRTLHAAEPKMTAAQMAEAANAILDKSGLGFAISFDTTTCDRLRKIKAEQKDSAAPLSIGATLQSVGAEGAALILPDPVIAPGDCGCYIELPLLEITDKDFIAVVSGRNIRFHRPLNFLVYEATLLDAKDKTSIKRKWRIPFRGTPIGVSHDENVLYLAFEEPELAALSLLVFGEGVFQIGTRSEAEEGGKGKLQQAVSGAPERRMEFNRWGKTYLVGFEEPCR